jgi:hypothetical protein
MRLASRFGKTIRGVALGSLSIMILAGCTASPSANPPSPSTTRPAFTHAQVLGWVTPTLGNGFSFVGSLSASSTAEQMFAASRPLSSAVSVSLRDLAEVPWRGTLEPREKSLARALVRVRNLTAMPPGPAYLEQLDGAIHSVQGSLQALTHAVKG